MSTPSLKLRNTLAVRAADIAHNYPGPHLTEPNHEGYRAWALDFIKAALKDGKLIVFRDAPDNELPQLHVTE